MKRREFLKATAGASGTTRARSFPAREVPTGELSPLVRVIDDFHRAHELGAVFETRVGAGKLLVCGFYLEGDLAARPVARQLRHNLLAYMSSERFQPAVEIE